MVAAEVWRPLEVRENMPSMGLEGRGHSRTQPRLERLPRLDSSDRPDPVDGSDADLHRVYPVDACAWRVCLQPAIQLLLEFDFVPLVLEESCGACERQ